MIIWSALLSGWVLGILTAWLFKGKILNKGKVSVGDIQITFPLNWSASDVDVVMRQALRSIKDWPVDESDVRMPTIPGPPKLPSDFTYTSYPPKPK